MHFKLSAKAKRNILLTKKEGMAANQEKTSHNNKYGVPQMFVQLKNHTRRS